MRILRFFIEIQRFTWFSPHWCRIFNHYILHSRCKGPTKFFVERARVPTITSSLFPLSYDIREEGNDAYNVPRTSNRTDQCREGHSFLFNFLSLFFSLHLYSSLSHVGVVEALTFPMIGLENQRKLSLLYSTIMYRN